MTSGVSHPVAALAKMLSLVIVTDAPDDDDAVVVAAEDDDEDEDEDEDIFRTFRACSFVAPVSQRTVSKPSSDADVRVCRISMDFFSSPSPNCGSRALLGFSRGRDGERRILLRPSAEWEWGDLQGRQAW